MHMSVAFRAKMIIILCKKVVILELMDIIRPYNARKLICLNLLHLRNNLHDNFLQQVMTKHNLEHKSY